MKHIFLMLAALAGGTAAAAPVVTVAVTTAMNPDTLTALCRASERLTGVITMRLVVRGVPVDAGFDVKRHFALDAAGQSANRTAVRAGFARLSDFSACGIAIDPLFFRRYGIQRAPVFVLHDAAPATADASCGKTEAKAVVVRGNVTAGFALHELRRQLIDAGETYAGWLPVINRVLEENLPGSRVSFSCLRPSQRPPRP